MKIEQIYTGCLAQGAYYITSENEAVIIDPLRETQPYIDRLEKDNVKLKYIFETHFHADFVSGHLDLSQKTGAPIVYGPSAQPLFEAIIATDEQIFQVGKIQIKVLHTPGHTLESSTYLLIDENGEDHAIFSGDTLFLGDVGRPDLAQKKNEMTQDQLAGMLYDSLYNKIMPLSDEVIVYPAHGAGSACGKNMMKETVDTLGNQKKMNYALNQPDKESFIQAVTEGLSAPPKYFGLNVKLNREGYESFQVIKERSLKGLSADEFEKLAESENAVVLDTRSPVDFHKGFIPRSINIGIKGDFAPWVGTIIVDVYQPLLLVSDPGTEEEVITRLSRVGFDHVIGFLDGGYETWEKSGKESDAVHRISSEQLLSEYSDEHQIIDVRKDGEFQNGHLKNADWKTLSEINDWFTDINDDKHFYIHCQGGYRSMIAASLLKSRGIHNFSEIDGGYNALKNHSELLN